MDGSGWVVVKGGRNRSSRGEGRARGGEEEELGWSGAARLERRYNGCGEEMRKRADGRVSRGVTGEKGGGLLLRLDRSGRERMAREMNLVLLVVAADLVSCGSDGGVA
jgi:hypothetical protein